MTSARLRVPVSPQDHARGALDSPVTLVEYGDYECPFCAAAYPVVEAVRTALGSELAFVYRHFPLANLHPHAEHAAEAAEAAGAQRTFWSMHEQLYRHQDALDDESLLEHAALIGLDVQRVAHDLATRVHLPRVRADVTGGARSGVNGTPTFFINGQRYEGPHDAVSIIDAIRAAPVLTPPPGRVHRG